jgi:sulfonate transport system substrate-binding protein
MGNIRELENAMHHALLVCQHGRIVPEDLPLITLPRRTPTGPVPVLESLATAPLSTPPPEPVDAREAFQRSVAALCEEGGSALWDDLESMIMRVAYDHARHNQLRMARLLGVSRNVVRARLLQFGILARATPEPELDEGDAEPPPATPARKTVRVGRMRFGPLTLMKIDGVLARQWAARGVDLEWSQFVAGPQVVEAIRDGRLDLGIVGETSSIVGQATDVPLVYLAAEPPFPEGQAIVVHDDSPIRDVADLRGKTIALNRGANSDYLLLRALEEAGLSYDDVHLSYVASAGARAAFDHREVDAWALWNPELARIKQTHAVRVLRDGRGLTENRLCYVATRAFADAHPQLIDEFLSEVRRAGLWINQNEAAAIDLFTEDTGVDRAAIAQTLAERRFGAGPLDETSLESQQGVADALLRARRIQRPVAVADARWSPPRAHGPALRAQR